MSSEKWRPFCFALNVLNMWNIIHFGPAVTVQWPKQWATYQISDVDLDVGQNEKIKKI